MRVIQPLQIYKAPPITDLRTEQQDAEEQQSSNSAHRAMEETNENRRHLSLSVMLSKPILALEFNCLNMNVEDPLIISE